jgi:hypothetical protein
MAIRNRRGKATAKLSGPQSSSVSHKENVPLIQSDERYSCINMRHQNDHFESWHLTIMTARVEPYIFFVEIAYCIHRARASTSHLRLPYTKESGSTLALRELCHHQLESYNGIRVAASGSSDSPLIDVQISMMYFDVTKDISYICRL